MYPKASFLSIDRPQAGARPVGRAACRLGQCLVPALVLLASGLAVRAAGPSLSAFAALPLSFEAAPAENGPDAFLARGLNYQFLISPTEAQLVLCKSAGTTATSLLDRSQLPGSRFAAPRRVRISFPAANPQAHATGAQPLPGKVNYLLGEDSAGWRVGTPTFAQVRIDQLYRGVDLVYYGNQQRLEYDFNLAPGVDAGTIAMHFDGVDRLTVSAEGDLVIGLGAEEIRQPRPTVYQIVDGRRQPVAGGYRLQDARTVAFQPGDYDHRLPLTIDPTLTYSSFFGGNTDDIAWAVKVYTNDNSIYLAGQTLSSQFPFARTDNFGGLTNHGGQFNGDGFVARLDSTGTNMLFFTYLGGEQDDSILDLALDGNGHAYVTGYTSSTNFPVVPRGVGIPGLPASTNLGGTVTPAKLHFSDAFVAELTSDGSSLVFSAFLGGSDRDSGIGICLDPSNYVYVTGYTYSTNFPTTNALVLRAGSTNPWPCTKLSGSNDVFVTKLAPAGTGVIYSTYLGGTNFDVGQGIAADAHGNAYITGYTCSTNFPVTGPLAPMVGQLNNTTNAVTKYNGTRIPPFDAFVAKIAPQGSNLLYSVFLGGTNNDSGFRIRVDPSGGVYVCGSTYSPEFPLTPDLTTNLYTPGLTNISYLNADAFLTKIVDSNNTPSIAYSVHFGGTGDEIAWDLAFNPVTTNIFVVGSTFSTNFSTFINTDTNLPFLLLTNISRSNDVFVVAFAPATFVYTNITYVVNNHLTHTNIAVLTNSVLTNLYSVLIGGVRDDFAFGVDVDPANNAYVVGQTVSPDFPTMNPLQPGMAGTSDGFLLKLQTADATAAVLVDTRPTGLQVLIDGVRHTTPFAANWSFASTHSLSTAAIQTNVPGSRLVWTSWSNGGAISNLVVPAGSNLTCVASFSPQYFLSTTASVGGAVVPPSGWHDAGAGVSVSALPAAGASFAGWTAFGAGSSASGNPATVTMNGPISQSAAFTGHLSNAVVVLAQGPGTVSSNWAGQTLVSGRRYTVTATPQANAVFTGWSGSLLSSDQTLSFMMTNGLVFQANFSTNGFLVTQGVYNGLFFNPTNLTYDSAGPFSATVNPSGAFSASFRVVNSGFSCSGTFVNGAFATVIPRSAPLLPLQVSLVLDPSGQGRITGYVSGETWTSPLVAERAVYSALNPAPQTTSKFTLRIPGSTNSLVGPGGDGFATVSVTPGGVVNLSGTLGDGMAFSQSASLSAFDRWPSYVSFYSGQGLAIGWLAFTNPPANLPGGPVFWVRPLQMGTRYYPSGFAIEPQTLGSTFAYTKGHSILNLTNGHIILQGGGLARNITNTFSLTNNLFTINPSTNRISLSVNSDSGLFQGSFFDTNSLRNFSFYGALFQSQTNGAGYFINTNQAGRVLLAP